MKLRCSITVRVATKRSSWYTKPVTYLVNLPIGAPPMVTLPLTSRPPGNQKIDSKIDTGMANWKKYIDVSINCYIAKYIDMSDLSREIYRYIRYSGRNIWTDYFFLNKHPSSTKHFLHQWQFLSQKRTKGFENKITGNFPSPSVCHKNLRFYWKLLRIIIYSLELEKLIITFFRKKMKNKNLLHPIYIEKYINIHRYIVNLHINISNIIYWYFRYINILLPSLDRHAEGGKRGLSQGEGYQITRGSSQEKTQYCKKIPGHRLANTDIKVLFPDPLKKKIGVNILKNYSKIM